MAAVRTSFKERAVALGELAMFGVLRAREDCAIGSTVLLVHDLRCTPAASAQQKGEKRARERGQHARRGGAAEGVVDHHVEPKRRVLVGW